MLRSTTIHRHLLHPYSALSYDRNTIHSYSNTFSCQTRFSFMKRRDFLCQFGVKYLLHVPHIYYLLLSWKPANGNLKMGNHWRYYHKALHSHGYILTYYSMATTTVKTTFLHSEVTKSSTKSHEHTYKNTRCSKSKTCHI